MAVAGDRAPDTKGDILHRRARAFAETWGQHKTVSQQAIRFARSFLNIFLGDPRTGRLEFRIRLTGSGGQSRLVWPGFLLLEVAASGNGFAARKADERAFACARSLPVRELPGLIVVSDMAAFRVYDLSGGAYELGTAGLPAALSFGLAELPDHLALFTSLSGSGMSAAGVTGPDGARDSLAAASALGRLHDLLAGRGFPERGTVLFLMRLIFCLFAEGTGLFGPGRPFTDFLQEAHAHHLPLAERLSQLFAVLDMPTSAEEHASCPGRAARPAWSCPWDKLRPDPVLAFPFAGSALFHGEPAPAPLSDEEVMEHIGRCSAPDWRKVSPAVFGDLFQHARTCRSRRALGEHYTGSRDILKLARPLFLDGLTGEYHRICAIRNETARRRQLEDFHKKLGALTFLDPACGCGSFLVVTFMKLRQLEIEVLRELKGGLRQLDVLPLVRVRPSAFHGIELDSFPAAIARTVMLMADHLCSMELGEALGLHVPALPLRGDAHILEANALRTDWETAFPDMAGKAFSFILGNPPYSGAHVMTREQKADMRHVFGREFRGAGILDHVAAWFHLASRYMTAHPAARTAFVATSSIVQGQQAALLWNFVTAAGQAILFAWRPFQWTGSDRGAAAVHCVIVGFGADRGGERLLWTESGERAGASGSPAAEPEPVRAASINGYLMADAGMACVEERRRPLCGVPALKVGCKPIDGGHYLFSEEERLAFLDAEPGAAPYFRRWKGSREFLHGLVRWCLLAWEIPPEVLAGLPRTRERIEAVRTYRLASRSRPTRELAATPEKFSITNLPEGPYIAIPSVSSENREIVPMGLEEPSTVPSALLLVLSPADLYLLGVLQSSTGMAWMRAVGGRLENSYRYSAGLVYNTFPWPEEPSRAAKARIRRLMRAVLDVRAAHAGVCLAGLYDPACMPDDLRRAHAALDRAVVGLYGARWRREEDIVRGLALRHAALVRKEDRQKEQTSAGRLKA